MCSEKPKPSLFSFSSVDGKAILTPSGLVGTPKPHPSPCPFLGQQAGR